MIQSNLLDETFKDQSKSENIFFMRDCVEYDESKMVRLHYFLITIPLSTHFIVMKTKAYVCRGLIGLSLQEFIHLDKGIY